MIPQLQSRFRLLLVCLVRTGSIWECSFHQIWQWFHTFSAVFPIFQLHACHYLNIHDCLDVNSSLPHGTCHILPNKRTCRNKHAPTFDFTWPYLRDYLTNLSQIFRYSGVHTANFIEIIFCLIAQHVYTAKYIFARLHNWWVPAVVHSVRSV